MHGAKVAATGNGGSARGLAVVLTLVLGSPGCRDAPDPPPIVVEPRGPVAAEAPRTSTPPAAPSTAMEPEVRIVHVPPPAARAEPDGPAEPDAAGEPTAPAPDTPLVRRVLPAGTPLAVELRTPLHTATSRRGDRFAARLVRSLTLEGRVAVPAQTMLEGRVTEVVSAEDVAAGEPDSLARIALEFHSLTLPTGERLPLRASVGPPPGRPVESGGSTVAGATGGAAAGAVLGGVIGRSGRSTAIGAVLGSAAGAAIMAAARNHEVIVPTGTRLDVVLIEPIPLP